MSNLIMMSGKQRLFQVGTCLTTSGRKSGLGGLSKNLSVTYFTGRNHNHQNQCRSSSFNTGSVRDCCGCGCCQSSVKHFSAFWNNGDVPVRHFRTFSGHLYSLPAKVSWRKQHQNEGNAALEYTKLLEGVGLNEMMEEVRERSNIITIPVHLEGRLEKKRERDNTKRAIREKIIADSRKGNKSHILIHCKNFELNHYLNQTYDKKKEVPLASRAWRHRKSSGDFFTLYPGFKRPSPFYMADTEDVTFSDLGVKDEQLLQNLRALGMHKPTHIQIFGLPQLLKDEENRNIVAAETGCGKTLVYVIPAIQQILRNRRFRLRQKSAEPSVIILTPSRELADQIYKVVLQLTYNMDINTRIVQGGNLGIKIRNPTIKPVDILVATTAALKVLSSAGVYGMGKVQHIIIDEADTLLDDSFFPDVVGPFLARFDWSNPQKDLQLTLVCATLPKDLKSTLGQVMKTHNFATVSTPGLHSVLPHIPQTFLKMRKGEKADKIVEIANRDFENKIPLIIFCNRSKTVDWLASHLNANGVDCYSVHGRMPIKFRKGRLDCYKRGEVNVLVCTDLASRGIDTVRTQHVINYEFPLYLADYIHRCGRTGRVGGERKSQITNFISRPGEVQAVNDIERSVRKETKLPDVNANIKRLFGNHYGQFKEILPISDDEYQSSRRRRRPRSDENDEEEEKEEDEDKERKEVI